MSTKTKLKPKPAESRTAKKRTIKWLCVCNMFMLCVLLFTWCVVCPLPQPGHGGAGVEGGDGGGADQGRQGGQHGITRGENLK